MAKIMLVGKAGAGKSTLAGKLEERGYIRVAFADKLKKIAADMKPKKLGPLNKLEMKDRGLLQQIGTDVGRKYDENIWVYHVDDRVQDILSNTPDAQIVIDDCRFLNEAKWGKENGFVIIRIVGRGYKLDPKLAQHRSETEQLSIVADYELDNSGSLDETVAKLDNYLNSLQ